MAIMDNSVSVFQAHLTVLNQAYFVTLKYFANNNIVCGNIVCANVVHIKC